MIDRKIIDSAEFRRFFLLEFTRQLIKNSAPFAVFELREIVEKEETKTPEERTRNEIKEIIQEKEKELSIISKEKREKRKELSTITGNFPKQSPPLIQRKSFPFENFRDVRLKIPETRLPQRLQHIRPAPSEIEIDLGKITPLLRDPFVNVIECDGENQNVIVHGKMGVKKTPIILSREDINEIIETISKKTKIPVEHGVFKVALGKIVFMSIVSEVIGSKFLIKKMLRAE